MPRVRWWHLLAPLAPVQRFIVIATPPLALAALFAGAYGGSMPREPYDLIIVTPSATATAPAVEEPTQRARTPRPSSAERTAEERPKRKPQPKLTPLPTRREDEPEASPPPSSRKPTPTPTATPGCPRATCPPAGSE